MLKKAVLELQDPSKLISRKIWEAEKFWQFHTVQIQLFVYIFFSKNSPTTATMTVPLANQNINTGIGVFLAFRFELWQIRFQMLTTADKIGTKMAAM